MQAMYCGNSGCPKHSYHSGGNFVYSRERRCFLCEDCFHRPPLANASKDRFWFTTSHFNGEPIEVKGIRHLRQLEQRYGCSNHTANFAEKDWSTPPPVKPFPMGRELAEMISYRTEPERRN